MHADDFTNLREIRRARPVGAESFYERNIDFARLVEEVLEPARAHACWEAELRVLDVPSDRFSEVRRYRVTSETTVVVEGVLLFRADLRRYLDCRIYVDVPEATTFARGPSRFTWSAAEVERRLRDRYLPGHRLYLTRDDPVTTSHLVVDNTDPGRPRILAARD